MARRGRPTVEDPRKNQFRLRLNEEEYSRLERLSKSTGFGRSDVLRIALEKYEELNNEK